MANVIIKRGNFELVPMTKAHVMQVFTDIAPYSAAEYEEPDLFYALDSMQEDADCMILEKNNVAVQLIGLQAIGNQQVYMWSSFTNQMAKHWMGVVRFSPLIIKYIHQTYYEINLNVSPDNEGTINWLSWMGFIPSGYVEDDKGEALVHFVRCNPDRKNVYALSSRPVMHWVAR